MAEPGPPPTTTTATTTPTGTTATGPQRLPAAVFALGLTSFFTDVGSEMIFPLLPAFVASLGGAPVFVGLVEGVADATAALLKLVSGHLADRTPTKKPLVLAGYVLSSVVRPLVAFAVAPWHVLAVRVTDRVGKGIRSSPRDALIANAVDAADAGRAFGLHRAMDHAGAVVGPLVATAMLASGLPLRAVFACAAVPGVLAVIALLVVRERPATPTPSTATATATATLPHSLRALLAIVALFALGNSSDAFLLVRAGELGVPVSSLPLLWTVFHVAKVGSAALGGRQADRVDRAKLIVFGWAVYAVVYVGFAAATTAWQVWALFVVYGCTFGLTEPAEKALVRELAPAALRGRAYGAYHFVIGGLAIPAGLLTGALWQRFGAPAALGVGAALAALAAVGLVVWRVRSRG